MRFKPMTESEIKNMGLLPEGQYSFIVADAKEQVSKAGNEMIKLELKVNDSQGRPFTVYDYLMEKMAYKLVNFCHATALNEQYEAGLLSAKDCIGKKGVVEIIIDEDKTGTYPNKNCVKSYITPKDGQPAEPVNKVVDPVADFFNDEIPF